MQKSNLKMKIQNAKRKSQTMGPIGLTKFEILISKLRGTGYEPESI